MDHLFRKIATDQSEDLDTDVREHQHLLASHMPLVHRLLLHQLFHLQRMKVPVYGSSHLRCQYYKNYSNSQSNIEDIGLIRLT